MLSYTQKTSHVHNVTVSAMMQHLILKYETFNFAIRQNITQSYLHICSVIFLSLV